MEYATALTPIPRWLPAIRRWLTLLITLVALMVLVGGVTRLSESGLSIVEWKLISGTLPPMSDAAWEAEFDAYKTSPQYAKVNKTFALADFQQIFWLEYLHRLLGRIVGLAIFLPLLYFALRRALPRPLLMRMFGITLLVGTQGTVGWIMVASGLVDQPRVAPIKLALHLLLAICLYMALLWTRWQVTGIARPTASCKVAWLARAALLLTLGQLVLGALVAGLRAGKSYNTYPLMDGQLIPNQLYLLDPWWRNHVESVLTVQFQHRMGALLVSAIVLALAFLVRKLPQTRTLALWLIGALVLQFSLGVATLLSVVDIGLASLHQLGALLLIGLLSYTVYLSPFDRNQFFVKKAA